MRVVKQWNGLPRKLVQSLSLKIFKTGVDAVTGDLFQLALVRLDNTGGTLQPHLFSCSIAVFLTISET